ncbi:hypothetical protein [Pseudoroseicyclus sp. CXY001]|uniref:hypothetical protein n=1 Tax=Pseudoroseicyclus sp. CXY001 TaxID=3242492 RepID=UPI00358DB684
MSSLLVICAESLVADDICENLAMRFPGDDLIRFRSFSDARNAQEGTSVPRLVVVSHELKDIASAEAAARFAEAGSAVVLLQADYEPANGASHDTAHAAHYAVLTLPFSDASLNEAVDKALRLVAPPAAPRQGEGPAPAP